MLWIILIAFLLIVGFAYNWLSVQVTAERVIMSIELARIAPLLKRARQGLAELLSKDRAFRRREHHS
jgi:hypothetical protein